MRHRSLSCFTLPKKTKEFLFSILKFIEGLEDLRTEDLKERIVLLVENNEFYGYEIHKILNSQGIKIEISRLYRILNEMLKDKIFSSRWEKSSSGPKKRIYKLDKKGIKRREEMLLKAIEIVHKFYGEYLQNLPQELNIFNSMVNYFQIRPSAAIKIGIVSQNKTRIIDILIKKIQEQTLNSCIYLIKPDSINVNTNLLNIMSVKGDYSTVPFKDNYLDLLIIIGIPEKDLFKESLNEWARSLDKTGKLIVIAPTVLIDEYRDPKDIGQFFEEFEHYESKKREKIGSDIIEKELKNLFIDVGKRKLVHVSLFKASKLVLDN